MCRLHTKSYTPGLQCLGWGTQCTSLGTPGSSPSRSNCPCMCTSGPGLFPLPGPTWPGPGLGHGPSTWRTDPSCWGHGQQRPWVLWKPGLVLRHGTMWPGPGPYPDPGLLRIGSGALPCLGHALGAPRPAQKVRLRHITRHEECRSLAHTVSKQLMPL